jgi:8-oxo-dGTP diphosphatase
MLIQKSVVKCLIEEKGKTLLIKEGLRSSWRPGKWSLPGGKMEENENFLEALARELEEETGLKVKINGLFRIEEIIAKINNEQRLVHHFVFIGSVISGELKGPDNSVAELKWFLKKDLTSFNVDDLAEFYYPSLFQDYIKNKNIIINFDKFKIWDEKSNKKFSDWLKISL